MAKLNDTVVSGNLRVTGTSMTDKVHTDAVELPTESSSTTYGVGVSGQVVRSNGTTAYWDDETEYSLGQNPTYLNTLIYTKTQSASSGGSSVSSIMIPTIVRGTMDDTTSTSTAFVVSASSTITSLYDGLTFIIKNTKVTSASGCTLNINNLGAKRIWTSQDNGYCTTHWGLNQTYLFVYDATNDRFELQQGRDAANDTYTLRPYYTRVMASGNGLKKYSLFARLSGTASASTESVSMDLNLFSSFTSDSGTGTKTYTNNVFDMTKIFYLNSSSDVASGSRSSNNTVSYEAIRVDLRYTFNITTSTLTAQKPVYLVFLATSALQPNYGQLANTINSGFPVYTQDIGETLTAVHADSTLEAYIARLRFVYLGIAEDGYRMDLLIDNPSYMPNPTVADSNKWRSLVSPTRGSVIYSSMRADADSDGNKFQDTYLKSYTSTNVTQSQQDAHTIVITHATITPSGGGASSATAITIPDNNTTYSMSRDGSSVKLTPSSGSAQTVSLSDLITGLSIGTSKSEKDDYLIAQYSGGGSSNNNYYRRKLSTIMADYIAFPGTSFTIPSGTICNGYVTGGAGNMELYIPLPKLLAPSVTGISLNKLPLNTRYSEGYYYPSNYTSNGYDFIAQDPGGGVSIIIARCKGTGIDVKISPVYAGVPFANANNVPVVARTEADITVTCS